MNLLDVAETEIKPTPGVCTTLFITTYDGKPEVFRTAWNHELDFARVMAATKSTGYPSPIRVAVYDKTGFLDSVYQHGERVVSRCD